MKITPRSSWTVVHESAQGAVAPEEPRIATLRLPIDATADLPLTVTVLDPPTDNLLKADASTLAGQIAGNV